MELTGFLDQGIVEIARIVGRFYLGNPRGLLFALGMAHTARKSARVRSGYEAQGTHIPPFLIASIASQCNLRCAGCYARAGGGCGEGDRQGDLTGADWQRIFAEAAGLGINFVLLAGGEPLLRRDVMEAAARQRDIIFPVFTNGTLLDPDYLALFHRHRNLIPVLSVEGDEVETDARRGAGVARQVGQAMESLHRKGALFGASITVTRQNWAAVTEPAYIQALRGRGCGLVFFVEYVPAQEGTEEWVLTQEDLDALKDRVEALRQIPANRGMNFLSFPGDEDNMGGCLAAGRGFFHINAKGGAEPCPFSPFSTENVKDGSLLDALSSPFFARVRSISAAEKANHHGGCTLFLHQDEVLEAVLKEKEGALHASHYGATF